jgi:hypothetical protein
MLAAVDLDSEADFIAVAVIVTRLYYHKP